MAKKVADPERFAEVYMHGDKEKGIPPGHLRNSMLEAGYSQVSANNGKNSLSDACKDALLRKRGALGKRFTPQERTEILRGSLLENVALGKDTAVKSLELMGKDKELGIFTPDSQVGVIILTAPKEYSVTQVVEPPPMPEETDLLE